MSNTINPARKAFFWVFAALVLPITTQPFTAETTAAVFELEQISVFEDTDIPSSFIVGVRAETSSEPGPEVKSYPPLKSEKVLYGSVWLGGEIHRSESGNRYHFAIDESAGTDTGYDSFYFDLNLDGNLSGDEVFTAV